LLPLITAFVVAGPALAEAPVVAVCDGEDVSRGWAIEEQLRTMLREQGREVQGVEGIVGVAGDPPEAQIRALKDEAVNAYELLEVELATESLNNADAIALEFLDVVPAKLIAEVAVVRASLQWGEGDKDGAKRSLRRALIFDPTMEPGDPLPRKARKVMRNLSDDLAFETPGKLVLRGPPGVTLWVDGQARGEGEVVIDPAAPGPHLVLPVREGRGREGRRVVEVTSGETLEIELPPPGPIEAAANLVASLRANDVEAIRAFVEAAEVEIIVCDAGAEVRVVHEAPLRQSIADGTVLRGEPRAVAEAILKLGAKQEPRVAGEPINLTPVLQWTGVAVGVAAVATAAAFGVVAIAQAANAPDDDGRRDQAAVAARRQVLGF
jgi:hypothetical protein